MSKSRYLLIDTETGGLDPSKHSLLTGYLAIVNPTTFAIEAEFEFKHAPEEFCVTGKAMEVNGINLVTLSQEGEKTAAISAKLYKWFYDITRTMEFTLHPLGQNYPFDLSFLKNTFNVSDNFLSRRGIDTASLALEAQLDGLLPPNLSLSLSSLANHFKLPPGEFHTARFDALTTLEVYKCLKKLRKS